MVLGFGCVLANVLVVRNFFGWVFVGTLGFSVLVWGARDRPRQHQAALVFLAVQLALSVFSRGDYLFSSVARTQTGEMPSDVAHIATALGGPYWLWGAIVGTFSLGVVALGAWVFLRAATAEKDS